MNAYIDFPNFCSYLNSMSNADFQKCNETLLENCNLRFTFDKSKMGTTKKEIRRNFEMWLRTATKNRNGFCNEWQCDFPNRPVKEASYDGFTAEQLTSIYMLDGEGVEEWNQRGFLLIAPTGKELDVIKQLQIEGSFLPAKSFRIRKMVDWSVLDKNSAPCTDIILVDPYIFAQSDVEYEVNAYALLTKLSRWARGFPINIVIFTMQRYKDGDTYRDINFKMIERQLKRILKEQTGAEPCITFVFISNKEQHDRTILTNYKMYTSGDSFKYFRGNEAAPLSSHGEWFYIHSLYDKDSRQNAQEFLKDMQDVIETVKKRAFSIVGDKKSLFLDFDG